MQDVVATALEMSPTWKRCIMRFDAALPWRCVRAAPPWGYVRFQQLDPPTVVGGTRVLLRAVKEEKRRPPEPTPQEYKHTFGSMSTSGLRPASSALKGLVPWCAAERHVEVKEASFITCVGHTVTPETCAVKGSAHFREPRLRNRYYENPRLAFLNDLDTQIDKHPVRVKH